VSLMAEDFQVWHELSPGGFMIIPPQKVTAKVTALEGGGCLVEAVGNPVRDLVALAREMLEDGDDYVEGYGRRLMDMVKEDG
jgi:hypothetical protein